MKIRQALKLLGRTKRRPYIHKTVELWPLHCMMGTESLPRIKTVAQCRVEKWLKKGSYKGFNLLTDSYSCIPCDPFASTKHYIEQLRRTPVASDSHFPIQIQSPMFIMKEK